MNSGKLDFKGSWGHENMTSGDQEATSPRPQQGLSSRFQDFMKPGYQELLRSGVLDLWNSWVQAIMISGHQGFLTSRDQDAKTSIRIDFLASLSHDGLSSRFIHSVLMQFCSRYRIQERTVRLFVLADEQRETGRDIRPVFGGQKHYMFWPRQVVFSVTRNIFRNAKQLARKGVENVSEVVAFYWAPRVPTLIFKRFGIFAIFTRNWLREGLLLRFVTHKIGENLVRFSPINDVFVLSRRWRTQFIVLFRQLLTHIRCKIILNFEFKQLTLVPKSFFLVEIYFVNNLFFRLIPYDY